MDTSAAGLVVTGPSAGPDIALPGVPSGPGWLVLRDCPLGGDGPPVALALLHPKIGVALVDFVPTARDTADRMKRALDARRFPAIFGGYPPIVRVVVPADQLAELGYALAARFKAEPPFALEGGDAWLPTARAALEAQPAAPRAASPGARRRDVSPWRAAVLIVGAAASGAAVAAALVMPPQRGSGEGPGSTPPVDVSGPTRARARSTAAPAPSEQAAASPTAPPAAESASGPEPMAPGTAPWTGTTTLGDPFPSAVPPGAAAGPAPDAAAIAAVPAMASATGAEPLPPAVPSGATSEPAPMAVAGPDRPEPPPEPQVAAATGGSAALAASPVPPPAAVPDPLSRATDRPRRQEPPARTAGLPPASPRTAPRTPPPAAKPSTVPPTEAVGGTRCRDILVRTTLGEGLSNGDKHYLHRGCDKPRN